MLFHPLIFRPTGYGQFQTCHNLNSNPRITRVSSHMLLACLHDTIQPFDLLHFTAYKQTQCRYTDTFYLHRRVPQKQDPSLFRFLQKINGLFLQSFIYQYIFFTKPLDLPGRGRTRHAAQPLHITAGNEIVCMQIPHYFLAHLLIGQLLFSQIPQFQRLHLQDSYFTAQCLVRTETDAFQLHFGTLPFCFQCHRLRTGQRRSKVANAVQMYPPALTQRIPHEMRQCIEHSQYIRLRQRAILLYMPAQLVCRNRAVQSDSGM